MYKISIPKCLYITTYFNRQLVTWLAICISDNVFYIVVSYSHYFVVISHLLTATSGNSAGETFQDTTQDLELHNITYTSIHEARLRECALSCLEREFCFQFAHDSNTNLCAQRVCSSSASNDGE